MEFLFSDDVATISQREVGTDTVSFSEALRNSMRQDPDIIMVGEMRDPETVATTITAAETGHLVFSTLHTNSASQTVDRILDTFPAAQQRQVKAQLAQVLKGVVSMQLLDRRGGEGLVAALEILRTSPKIADLIERGETARLPQQIESSVAYFGMQSMNQSLLALLVHGTIDYAEAMQQSPDPDDLSLKLRKMFPQIEEQGDPMASTSDFSQILELQQIQKLYEEQEARVKHQLSEKDQEAADLRHEISERDRQLEEYKQRMDEIGEQLKRSSAEHERVQREQQEKIDKLTERVRALNQQLMENS
jgi:twitching motility protein PilT